MDSSSDIMNMEAGEGSGGNNHLFSPRVPVDYSKVTKSLILSNEKLYLKLAYPFSTRYRAQIKAIFNFQNAHGNVNTK